MADSETPKIFISYAHEDRAIATALATALEVAGFKPWIDLGEIRPGDSFLEKMNEGLAGASYLLLLVSAASNVSRWVTREWTSAFARQSTLVLPVLVEPIEPPALLTDIVYFDWYRDKEKAIRDIVGFFKRETHQRPVEHGVRSPWSLSSASRRQLRLVAMRCLDEEGLRAFCFDALIDHGRLQGTSLNEKLVSLLHVVATDGILRQFAEWLQIERTRCVDVGISEMQQHPSWTWSV